MGNRKDGPFDADGADGGITFIDAAQGHTILVTGNANTSTDSFKFGNASIGLDGTSDYLNLSDSADWVFGTGDFTIDFWANFVAFNEVRSYMFESSGDVAANDNVLAFYMTNTGKLGVTKNGRI